MLCMRMRFMPPLLIIYVYYIIWNWYFTCLICDVLYCIRTQLHIMYTFIFWMLRVHTDYIPWLHISNISFVGLCFVNNSFIYTYVITCIYMWSYKYYQHVMYILGICYMILVCQMVSFLGLGSWWPSSRFCG